MFKCEFSRENDAFNDEKHYDYAETVRILEDIVEAIKRGSTHGPIMDIDGNKVGSWSIE